MTRAPLLGRGLHALWSGEAAPRSADGQPVLWDVVIVGTGYGGSAAAAALAGCTVADDLDGHQGGHQGGRRPLRLCILERGQEWRPGDFPSSGAPRSDAWDGYPASLDRLLDFLMSHQIRHTVFLSGDEHHALVCHVTLHPPPDRAATWRPVQLTSVHSSALYAPLAFANGHPADLSDQAFVTAGGTRVTMCTHCAPPGDGWARVSLTPGAGPGDLEVEFVKARPPQDSG